MRKSDRKPVDPKKAAKRIGVILKALDPNHLLAEGSELFQITCLLSDIQHWCDANGVHYVRAEDVAREMYATEVIEQRKQAKK